ncbi:MAG: arcB 3 [Segetibacter sp.]|nr:arcB 3 [Segetibacter sp.]
MVENNIGLQLLTAPFRLEVKKRSDKIINYFLLTYFLLGFVLAYFYDTWLVAFGIGSLSLLAYYSVKLILPASNLYQYVLSVVLGTFMAQFIYQMHGLFEMHFTAFIGSAILITYQNWKLQIPMLIVVIAHHSVFSYLQNTGVDGIYFTQLDFLDLQTFVIHIILAGVIFFICGLWAYQLKKYSETHIMQTVEMAKLQKEALLSIERKRNEEALEKSNSELRKSNAELDKFVYSVSHDLRAPLTSMLGIIDISEEVTEDPFINKNLGFLKSSIKKLDVFIADILHYSRNSRLEVVKEQVDFRQLTNEVMDKFKFMCRKTPAIKVDIDIIEDSPFVCDKQRLVIVFNNLISNAIRYHSPVAESPFINISVHSKPEEVFISVKDNGIGVKKELQEKIFNMFYRISPNSEGSGLGLYIVKETIEKLNGRIEIESELGTGTEFKILIPNVQLN